MTQTLDIISRELIYFWLYFSIQFQQIVWYWALGMALGSLVSVFGKEKIHRAFALTQSKKPGILGLVPASLLGIASPLCMYGTIPIVASFAAKGMSDDSPSPESASSFDGQIAAFMVSSVLLNPQILFYTAALGVPMLIIRFVSCFVCGILAGICVRLFFRNKRFFNFKVFEQIANRDTDPNLLVRFLKNYGRNIRATGVFFLIGIVLSALFQRYVPPYAFARLFGSNRGLGILLASTIGVPLYICGGGTIPLIITWMHSGMSMGTAASFMIAGPAMKITNLGALKIVLGIKHFLYYIAFAVLFAFLTGVLTDWGISFFQIPAS
ncbi:MAG: permease [Treponema sp.]|nr:permease [Treponema sp.]